MTENLKLETGGNLKPANAGPMFGFDSAFLQRLQRLAVLNRRPLAGSSAGPRRSPRHGASVEFADFRSYAPGDDFRRIDWNAYARLGRVFLRLYQAEESGTVTILLDHSTSMSFGEPSKALTAGRLAAILSYIALHNYDAVTLAGWSERIDHFVPRQRGTSSIPGVWRAIARLMDSPVPATDFGALRQFGTLSRTPGMAVVLSDFLSDSDWPAGLRGLRAAGQEVTAIQILAPEELRPSLRGDCKLIDAESDTETEVTVSPRLLRRYHEELERHTQGLRAVCNREGIIYLQLPSDLDVPRALIGALRSAGVLA